MNRWKWLCAGVLAACMVSCNGEATEGTRVGSRAPEFEGDTPKGDFIRLSDYRGKVVVLDFWATWCRPCVASLPDTARLVREYQNRPVAFIGISQDRDRQTLQAFLDRNPFITWPNIFDGASGPIAEQWSVNMLPTIIIIDHQGIVRHQRLHPEDLADALDKIVRAAE